MTRNRETASLQYQQQVARASQRIEELDSHIGAADEFIEFVNSHEPWDACSKESQAKAGRLRPDGFRAVILQHLDSNCERLRKSRAAKWQKMYLEFGRQYNELVRRRDKIKEEFVREKAKWQREINEVMWTIDFLEASITRNRSMLGVLRCPGYNHD